MYITVQNSWLKPYQAKVFSLEPLPDFYFKVKYYDDEGLLCEDIVTQHVLDGEL